MKRIPRLSRGLAASASLAAAAILLPTAALAASGSAGQASNHAVSCAAANTRVWYGVGLGGAAAGHTFIDFQLSNVGHSTCTFFGYPGVSALNAHNAEVGKPASHSGTKISVALAPGSTAHFVLNITDASLICTHPVHATQIRVFPPGQFHAQSLPLATQQCVGRSVMHVDAVHPRAGIPGFSAS